MNKEAKATAAKAAHAKALPGWKDLPRAGIILEPGNALQFQTGDWRVVRPVWIETNCIQCMLCWTYCPDNAVRVENGKVTGFDLAHCKGCGICANECPGKIDRETKERHKAIEMVPESKFRD
ncbi:MAG: 4Fe-4S binding protein [Firmicutes bacterium]|nr:4Fe-4S binding protein [Bacillota bacterium]